MKGFIAVAKKEWLHIKRDPTILFFALVIPCIQMTILGFAFNFDVRHLSAAVADFSQSRESRQLIQKLSNTQYMRVTSYKTSETEAMRSIRIGQSRVALIIPPDYERSKKALVLLDGSDAQVAAKASVALRGPMIQDPNGPKITMRLLYNPGGKTNVYLIPGLIGIVLQLCTIVLTSLSLVKEKEQGTLEQLMVTPINSVSLMLGKITPYAIMAMAEMVLILFVAWLVFSISSQGSLIMLTVATVPFVIATLALGLLISTAANTQNQALQMVIVIIIPSILLSGFIFPLDSIPTPLYLLSQILPTTHYMQILRGVIIRGAGIEELLTPTLVLCLMSVVLISISTFKFRKSVN